MKFPTEARSSRLVMVVRLFGALCRYRRTTKTLALTFEGIGFLPHIHAVVKQSFVLALRNYDCSARSGYAH